MRIRTLLLALAAGALAPAAVAQKIPSAEAGVAPLAFAEFSPPGETVTVKPGEVAWQERVIPLYVVRLIDPAKPRPRPNTDGLPAQTLLFGYQLSTGMAYCPPLNPDKSHKRVQCFRDLDNDLKFDAGYVSDGDDADSRYFSSFLRAIAAVPKYRYENAPDANMPAATGSIIFVDMKDGAPRFKMRLDNENLENIHACEVTEPSVCNVYGVQLRFGSLQEGALTITFEGAATNRSLNIMNTFDPLKH
jgi:hypothetical protein